MSKKLPYILIPAAGQSRRFRDEGYQTPKPFLRIRNSNRFEATMVRHVIDSAPPGLVFLGVRPGPYNESVPPIFIQETKGQADTLYQMVGTLTEQDRPVLVLDCDMILEPKDLHCMLDLSHIYDVVVAVTHTFDPNASRVDQVPFPREFAEKEPISAWGIVGARVFKRPEQLQLALAETLKECAAQKKEPYLSMALNYFKPGSIYALVIDSFQDWGTPERIRESGAKIIG